MAAEEGLNCAHCQDTGFVDDAACPHCDPEETLEDEHPDLWRVGDAWMCHCVRCGERFEISWDPRDHSREIAYCGRYYPNGPCIP